MIAAPTCLRHHGAALALLGLTIAGCSDAPPDLPQNPNAITYRVVQSDLYLQNKDRMVQDKLGFQPRSGVPPWPLALPLDWGADPFSDGNWRFQLNAWRMIDPMISDYFETQDAGHLHDAMVYVRDWYDFNITRRKRNEFAWYDMSTGIRAMQIATLEGARREGVLALDDSDRNMLRELAWEHIERTRKDGISQNNHGLFQLAGLGLLCRVYAQDPICAGVESYVREELGDLLADQFTDEGVHKEHSPDYHAFMLRSIERIGALKPFMGDIDLELIRSVSPWLVFPDGSNARIGDSEKSGHPLSEDSKARCLPSGSCFAVGDFTRSGYAIVRDLPSDNPDSMIFVTGMAYSTTHRHADALSFELFEGGRFLFVDGGKYGYDNTEERRHFAVSDAHNMVGFAQVPLAPNRYPQEGSFLDPIKTEADSFIISGDVEVTRAFTHRRKLLYRPGVHLRIEDTIETAEDADYEPLYVSQLLLAPDLIPTVQNDQFTVQLGERQVTARLETADCRIETARGARNPLLGWHSPSYNKMVPATLVRAVCPGPDRTIVWDIDLGGADGSVQIGDIEPIERSE